MWSPERHEVMARRKELLEGGPFVVLYIDMSGGFGGAINSLYNTVVALDGKRFEPVLVSSQKLGGEWDKIVTHRVQYKPYYRFMGSMSDRIARSGIPTLLRRLLNG
ncbi:MAG: hypothetical protein MN733_12350, partial [Nitrososphaera sp.]|nr:hypothetical protein [Nitrososphaera sp.]